MRDNQFTILLKLVNESVLTSVFLSLLLQNMRNPRSSHLVMTRVSKQHQCFFPPIVILLPCPPTNNIFLTLVFSSIETNLLYNYIRCTLFESPATSSSYYLSSSTFLFFLFFFRNHAEEQTDTVHSRMYKLWRQKQFHSIRYFVFKSRLLTDLTLDGRVKR